MGPLKLPASGMVYVDANCVIYAIEKIRPYDESLEPLWQAAVSGNLSVISSEIVLLKMLVKPIREKKATLEAAFRAFLLESNEFHLVPIELRTIERAARLRAHLGLKAPDAIHAATALEVDCVLFLTNDATFRRVDGLSVTVLAEVVRS